MNPIPLCLTLKHLTQLKSTVTIKKNTKIELHIQDATKYF